MPLQTRPRPTSPPSPSSLLHRRPSPPSPASSTLTYLAGHGHEGHEHAQGPVRTKKWNRADPDGKADGRAKRKKGESTLSLLSARHHHHRPLPPPAALPRETRPISARAAHEHAQASPMEFKKMPRPALAGQDGGARAWERGQKERGDRPPHPSRPSLLPGPPAPAATTGLNIPHWTRP